MKLIALPFAGGSKHSYNYLEKGLSQKGIQLIGMGYYDKFKKVAHEKKSLEEVTMQLVASITELIESGEEYVIYGHSMGALIGYAMCKEIERRKMRNPIKLVVSGRNAPQHSKDNKTYTLSSEAFWERIHKFGGLPTEIIQEKSIRDIFEPDLRKDFECAEQYIYKGPAQLKVPIDVFYGSEEDMSSEHINAWKTETNGKVTITELTGNHFFISDHKDYFIQYFQSLFQLNATI